MEFTHPHLNPLPPAGEGAKRMPKDDVVKQAALPRSLHPMQHIPNDRPARLGWLGIQLVKYFFDVSQEEQERRFLVRATDPMRYWKLSPMDVVSWQRWWDYTAAYHRMLEATDTQHAPWYRVQANDKRRARLNCISHLLSLVPYKKMDWQPPEMGTRMKKKPDTPEQLTFKHEVPRVC